MRGNVVFTLEDLKSVYDKEAHGYIGMWGFHAKLHDGHRQCGKIVRNKCDYVVGVYYQNFGEGMRVLTGQSVDSDAPYSEDQVEQAMEFSDVLMVFKDDYHPYVEHRDYIDKIFQKNFPEELLVEKGIRNNVNLYSSLYYGVAARILIQDIYKVRIDYQPTCGRDRWRMLYEPWVENTFNMVYDLLDAKRDELGNVISGMRNKIPKEIQDRIKKRLILPHFKTREEVEEHIKDIEGLHLGYFFREYGWIQCQFYFEPHQWWAEGLKLGDSV